MYKGLIIIVNRPPISFKRRPSADRAIHYVYCISFKNALDIRRKGVNGSMAIGGRLRGTEKEESESWVAGYGGVTQLCQTRY